MQDDESPSGQAVDTSASIVHRFQEARSPLQMKLLMVVGGILVVLAGVLTGYFLAPSGTGGAGVAKTKEERRENLKEKPKTAAEDIAFRDCAEGRLERIPDDKRADVEGTHKLIRGDESQTAYLTSSVVDMDRFRGKDVTVWGETHQSNVVGWLMDVGRVLEGKGSCEQ